MQCFINDMMHESSLRNLNIKAPIVNKQKFCFYYIGHNKITTPPHKAFLIK